MGMIPETIEDKPDMLSRIWEEMGEVRLIAEDREPAPQVINNFFPATPKGHAFGIYSGGVVVPHNTETTIPIDISHSNPYGWLDTDSGIFTVPADGIYFVSGGFIILFGALHNEHAWIQVNGGALVGVPTVTRHPDAPGSFEFCAINGMLQLSAGQTVTFQAFHLAGGANTMQVNNGNGDYAGIWLIERI